MLEQRCFPRGTRHCSHPSELAVLLEASAVADREFCLVEFSSQVTGMVQQSNIPVGQDRVQDFLPVLSLHGSAVDLCDNLVAFDTDPEVAFRVERDIGGHLLCACDRFVFERGFTAPALHFYNRSVLFKS